MSQISIQAESEKVTSKQKVNTKKIRKLANVLQRYRYIIFPGISPTTFFLSETYNKRSDSSLSYFLREMISLSSRGM